MDKKNENINLYNRVQDAVYNMGLWHLERKPQFLERARTEFERECQFYLDDDGNESLQVFMSRVFTDWILFESNVFETSAIQHYLGNCNSVSDEDRSILEQVDSNQKFEFFRFDGLFEDGVDGNGIVVYDPFAGKEISVHSKAPYNRARYAYWSAGTGVSMRTTEVDGESYMIGQFFAHDRAQIDDGMTFYIAKLSHAYHESPMLPIAIEILNPDGVCNKDGEIQSVVAA